ncbi:ribosome hibernation-promoting factor, HPF/YfiA family [Paenactinomyces guangxiensis]|uniref:Ribosome hibernation promoting factor n=1 Tax=Paenactinomyces guangxiensis TaxID=1490290 RepID=A0A7W2A891_9BACL|nr:ribosome-associated translation inhibitor RaiA [Paenactinomyces guangxiensis]MBA4495361.1 ribosome-associated translation inhibitor RaiA [Paenactinomyces guangxiensis]MBH8592518.1 ribosome-associated translation inhibitor RaiA [Paenactinomyces guangxiensis]
MKYVIRGNNIEVTDALRDFVEKKLSRLEKYFETPPAAEAHVALSVLKDEHKVEVTIPFPGLLVRAEESSEDMYASVDLVVQKLERQIRKYKTKMNRKFRQDATLRIPWKEHSPNLQSTSVVAEEEEEIKIVRTKRFNLKPMDAEEAVLQMDMLGHNFFVFSNAVTDQINVVYKRKDGKYGLIEPE